MNKSENHFYLASTDVNSSEYQKIKENSVYILKTLVNVAARIANTEKYVREGFKDVKIDRSRLVDENFPLPRTETDKDKEIGRKLNYLIKELDKEKNRRNPEFIKKFKESGLWKAVVLLRNGADQANLNTKSWITYKSKTDKNKEKFALNSALDYYKNTSNISVGLNVEALLDTVSILNEDKYISIDEITNIIEATNEFIFDLRKNPIFSVINFSNDFEYLE